MSLDPEFIRRLAEDESADLPPITAEQARFTMALFKATGWTPGEAPDGGPEARR